MSNTANRTAPKKSYTITNKQMLVFLDKLPSLKDNNKNTEFNLPVQSNGEEIIEGNSANGTNKELGEIKLVNIHFSYDFVNDRWFINDNKIEVIDLDRD